MARWTFKSASWSAVAVADATNYANSQFMALQGGSSTQRIDLWEVYVGGQATSGAVSIMLLSRDSTVGATPTSLTTGESNAADDPATAALAAAQVAFTAASTKPQRSATLGLLNLSLNIFGGVVRWYAGEQAGTKKLLGNTASFGEMSLSAFTGSTTGSVGCHLGYETI